MPMREMEGKDVPHRLIYIFLHQALQARALGLLEDIGRHHFVFEWLSVILPQVIGRILTGRQHIGLRDAQCRGQSPQKLLRCLDCVFQREVGIGQE